MSLRSSGLRDAPPDRWALADRIEQRPVALLHNMAQRKRRARLLAERVHHPVVAVVAKQHDANESGKRSAALLAQRIRHVLAAIGCKVRERSAREGPEIRKRPAHIV